ncbi:hypothetical protein ACN38_g7632 [Penicillium nordicum]|uniref:Uncharacterized protein n=1 Tax=Penicillium nordicum TaxID=229535 RepID=A0A0M8P6Q2_9EURO|nr:hypothetical protein ACN38_g7632 [Penicillium nordicum]
MNCSQSIETRPKFLLLVLSPVRQRLDTKCNDIFYQNMLGVLVPKAARFMPEAPRPTASLSLLPLRPSALRQILPCCFFNRNSVGSLLKYVLDLIYNIQFGF